MRGVTVEKYRGSSHDHRLRMMKITNDGLIIKIMAPEKTEQAGEASASAEKEPAHESEQFPPPPEEPLPPPPEAVPSQGSSGVAQTSESVTKKEGGS